jgi:hypothetical protein
MAGILPNDMKAPSCSNPAAEIQDPLLAHIFRAYREQNEFAYQRAELSQQISDILEADIQVECERAFGTGETRERYKRDFRRFQEFCKAEKLPALPTSPEAVAYFILARAGQGDAPHALARMVSAIKFVHGLDDKGWSFDDVMIRAALRFVRRHWDEEAANGAPKPNGSAHTQTEKGSDE